MTIIFINQRYDKTFMTRVLFTGGSGRIGRFLVPELEDLLNPGDEVDLLKNKTSVSIPKESRLRFQVIPSLSDLPSYDLAIHLGAMSNTTYCEKHPEEAKVTNVGLTRRVCDQSQRVIMLSTDYVFKGDIPPQTFYKETDPKDPFYVYGETKAEAEDIVLRNNGTVLRIQTLMGVPNRIVDAARKAISGHDPDYYPPYTNFSIRPTNFQDLLRVFERVAPVSHPGIYHVSCSGDALSRARMAEIVLDVYQKQVWPRVIEAFKTEEYKETKRFALGTEKIATEFGIFCTDGETAIRQHVLKGL